MCASLQCAVCKQVKLSTLCLTSVQLLDMGVAAACTGASMACQMHCESCHSPVQSKGCSSAKLHLVCLPSNQATFMRESWGNLVHPMTVGGCSLVCAPQSQHSDPAGVPANATKYAAVHEHTAFRAISVHGNSRSRSAVACRSGCRGRHWRRRLRRLAAGLLRATAHPRAAARLLP